MSCSPDDLAQPGLGRRLGVGGDGHVVERDAVGAHERLEVGVVRHDRGDVGVEGSGPPPEEQVVEAVPEPAHHDQGAVGRRRVADRPLHAVCRGHRREQLSPPRRVGSADLDGEPDPHEELVGADVVELLALLDVRPVLEEQRRDGGDDAALVGARQDEDVLGGRGGGVGHRATVRPRRHPARTRPAPTTPVTSGSGRPAAVREGDDRVGHHLHRDRRQQQARDPGQQHDAALLEQAGER